MKLNNDELQKALGIANSFVKKSTNFVNGDGRDNRDTIHSNPINNENGSISRTAGATGDGNDPVNSSNLTHTNPVGQTGNGVHAEGTKTTKPDNAHGDPVDTSGDGHADDPENKSETQKSYDSSKDKNGANRPHTPLKNGTRDLGDKPNANAKAENNITSAASGTKHNDADIGTKSINAIAGLTKSVNIMSGQINALNNHFESEIKDVNGRITKSKGMPNTTNLDKETKAVTGADKENKHIPPANVRGMFYHAEHAKGKGKHSKTHQMAEAEHAVTECHNSHKSIDDNTWKNIEAKGVEAMKNVMNSMADDEAKKSLDSRMSSAVKAGNSSEVGKINYQMNHKADKSMQKMTPTACAHMMARAANTHNSAMMRSCEAQMAHDMSSGKASAASSANKSVNKASSTDKNITNVDHNSSASTSNMSAWSKSKPDNASDDINHSTKSESANETKSMPHGKAINADTPVKKSVDKNNNVKKNVVPSLNPTLIRNRAKLYKSIFKQRGKFLPNDKDTVNKSINMANEAAKDLNSSLLQKSLNTFNSINMPKNKLFK